MTIDRFPPVLLFFLKNLGCCAFLALCHHYGQLAAHLHAQIAMMAKVLDRDEKSAVGKEQIALRRDYDFSENDVLEACQTTLGKANQGTMESLKPQYQA
ncbi:MAG: hypothetical protein EA401_02230 [Planctomycetota bacterium]|nr:MAG: hypothetical protein EA401_02230 [Planctomycetota bacterium]